MEVGPSVLAHSDWRLLWRTAVVPPHGDSCGLGACWCLCAAVLLRFHFYISSDALIVERGIFQRERLQIPFDRIQAVQLFQGPIQQVFGLTGSESTRQVPVAVNWSWSPFESLRPPSSRSS